MKRKRRKTKRQRRGKALLQSTTRNSGIWQMGKKEGNNEDVVLFRCRPSQSTIITTAAVWLWDES